VGGGNGGGVACGVGEVAWAGVVRRTVMSLQSISGGVREVEKPPTGDPSRARHTTTKSGLSRLHSSRKTQPTTNAEVWNAQDAEEGQSKTASITLFGLNKNPAMNARKEV